MTCILLSRDRFQLQQVLLNLVRNGIEAMNVGERERQLLITTRNIDVDQVQMTVEDTGHGTVDMPLHPSEPWRTDMGYSE